MPYVQRDESGAIKGMFANPQDFTSEFLPDDDEAVVAFSAPVETVDEVVQVGAADGIASVDAPSPLQDQVNALTARVASLEAKVR